MLKQLFTKEQVLKVISSKDIWHWKVLSLFGDAEEAAKHIAKSWNINGHIQKPLKTKQVKGKTVFLAGSLEDQMSIKLVDYYLRRIYKVRQSDRHRTVRQVITLMRDPSRLAFIKLDIKNCYESISFFNIVQKLREDMILSPTCIEILDKIHNEVVQQGNNGLPRGLSISTTLAELYLEDLDRSIAKIPNVIFMARYVDDIVLVVPEQAVNTIKYQIEGVFNKLNLQQNIDKSARYLPNLVDGKLDLLGYSISSRTVQKEANDVYVGISNRKINKIKERVALSFLDFKKNHNFTLLKNRIYYLCTLRVVKENENGSILSGNAYNYMYATDFDALKSVDGLLLYLLDSSRYNLSTSQKNELKKISFYHLANKKAVMKLTKTKTVLIKEAWKYAKNG